MTMRIPASTSYTGVPTGASYPGDTISAPDSKLPTTPVEKAEVSGGSSGWLKEGMKLLKTGTMLYLIRSSGATAQVQALEQNSVPRYETAEDLVRTLVERVGIDNFHLSDAYPVDGSRYMLSPGPNSGLVETVLTGLEQAGTDHGPLGLHMNALSGHRLTENPEYYPDRTLSRYTVDSLNLRASFFTDYGVPVDAERTPQSIGRGAPVRYNDWSNTSTLVMHPSAPLTDPGSFHEGGFAVCNLTRSQGSQEPVIFVTPLTQAVRPGFERMLQDGKFDKHCRFPADSPSFFKTTGQYILMGMMSLVGVGIVVVGANKLWTTLFGGAPGGAGGAGGGPLVPPVDEVAADSVAEVPDDPSGRQEISESSEERENKNLLASDADSHGSDIELGQLPDAIDNNG